MNKVWSLGLRIGRALKRAMTEPYSDRYSRMLVALWTLSTVLALGSLGLSIMNPSPFSLVWVTVNSVTAAFDVTMFIWTMQGVQYRKVIRQREAVDRKFVEVVLGGYS